MKEKLLFNQGFSLLEALVSIVVLSLTTISFLILISNINKYQHHVKASFDEYAFIDSAHDIFCEEPLMFKETLAFHYGDKWNEYFEYHYNNNLVLVYLEDHKGIELRVIYKGEWAETWERKYV